MAHSYQGHCENWKRLFQLVVELNLQSRITKPQKKTLKVIEQGYRMQFQNVSLSRTDGRPRAEHRYKKVRAMVARAVGWEQVDSYITGDTPTPIHFNNYDSVDEQLDFVRMERDVCLKSGSLVRWWDLPHKRVAPSSGPISGQSSDLAY